MKAPLGLCPFSGLRRHPLPEVRAPPCPTPVHKRTLPPAGAQKLTDKHRKLAARGYTRVHAGKVDPGAKRRLKRLKVRSRGAAVVLSVRSPMTDLPLSSWLGWQSVSAITAN